MRRRAWFVVAVSTATVLAGCSSGPDATTSTTMVTTTTSTSSLPPTTTEPAKATGSAATSDDAAAVLVAAWQHDDRAQAATIADAIAVMGMWATPRETINRRGCTTDDSLPEGGCVYRTPSGLVQINTEKRPQGWVVTSAVYDPLDNGNETSGNAPDAPPPTTAPPVSSAPTSSAAPVR
jgi:hypothetical protein